MAKRTIVQGSTNVTIDIFIQDSSSTTGAGLTGLVFNSGSLTCYFREGATATPAQLTLATQTVGGAHTDGGFVELDGTNMPGLYRLDLSDTIVSGTNPYVTIHLKGATNMAPVTSELELTNIDPFDAVRAGLTALPNAAADAAGGLPISDAGGLDLDSRLDADVSSRLAPTVASRTLDITATGAAGIDWANVEGQATSVNLSSTTTNLVNTTTTNTDQRGTDSALLASSAPTNFSDLSITVTTGLVDITQTAADKAWSTAARTVTASTNITSDGVAINTTSGAIDLVTLVTTTTTNTDMRGTDSAGTAVELAKVPKSDGTATWNATALGSINAECDTALTDYDGPTNTEMEARTILSANYATSSSISALNNISVNDILTTQMTETYAADAVAPTLSQALFLIQQTIGDFSIAGTTITTKRLDGSTTAATYTLDDGTNPTSRTRAT